MSLISTRRAKKIRRNSNVAKNGRLRLERLEERVVLSANYLTFSVSGDWDVATDSLLVPDAGESQAIVITGTKDPGLIEEMAAIRLGSDGVLDTAFGEGGVASARVGKWYNSGQAAAPIFENDVFAGFVMAGTGSDTRYFDIDYDFATARFDVDGNLIGDYGSKGMELTDLGAKESLGAVAVDANGYIYGAGLATNLEGSNEFVLVRYTPTGELDTDFGIGGVAERFDMPASYSHATDVALLSDGRAVVTVGDGMAVACYNTSGSTAGYLDDNFGTDGIFDLDVSDWYPGAVSSWQTAKALVIDSSDSSSDPSSDKIIVAGHARIELADGDTKWVFAVARFSPTGALDTDFGQNGIAVANFFEDGGAHASDVAIGTDPDNGNVVNIVVVGSTYHPGYGQEHFAVARFTPTGQVDTTFGDDVDGDGVLDGTVVTPILRSANASTVSIQGNGSIVVAGFADTGLADPVPRRVYTVIRYLQNGDIDPNFGDPYNAAPIANLDSATTDIDTPVTIAVLDNDTDGDTLAGILVKDPMNGSVMTSAAGTLFTYTPDAGYNGTDTFQYVAWDGLRASEITTVTITVEATVNQPPVAVDDSTFTDVDTPVVINVLENDSDPNNDQLRVISVTHGTYGTVSHTDDTVTYTPSGGYTGLDSFEYTITDDDPTTADATAMVTVDIRSGAPVAVDDSTFTDVDTPVVINVLENDSDPNNDQLRVISVTHGTYGTVSHTDDTVTYTPSGGYTGLDSFEYTITDDDPTTADATAMVTVDIRSDWFPDDQLSWWTADGDANDVMGLNHGTLVGGASFDTGKLGQAFQLDGVDDYVDVNGSSSITGSRTITAWVKLSENTGYGLPIVTGGISGQGDFFGIAGTSGTASVGQYELYVDHWGTTAYDSNIAVTPDTWNHVAMTYDGSNVRFYVNGVAGDVVSGTLYDYGVDTFDIGGNNIGGTTTKLSFNGLIDDVQLYSRSLLPGEVAAIYDAGAGPAIAVAPRSGLVTSEDGSTAEFTVVLASSPTAPVSIELSSSDSSEGGLVGATDNSLTLSFNSTNWNVPQTVTVTGMNDDASDGDINYTIVTTASVSNDSNYNGLDAGDVLVTNLDDDGSPTMHVGDLDATSTKQGSKWTAFVTITIHDSVENPVAGATVTGDWSGGTTGTASCTTDALGMCTVKKSKITSNEVVAFTVTGVSGSLNYESGGNHDDDGDSDGTVITVNRPLHAAKAAVTEELVGVTLTESMVQPVMDTAIAYWAAAGVRSHRLAGLREATIEVADMGGSLLGMAYSDWIVLDRDAAGYGWSTARNANGSTSSTAVDLLAVVTHEFGHLLGYGHNTDSHDVMAATLPVGTRRLPGLEPIAIEHLLVGTLPNLELNTRIPVAESPTAAKSTATFAESNFDLFLAPLVMDQLQQITGSPEAIEVRIYDDVLDDETELVEEELLDLLLG